jgi:MFS family permease
MDPNHDSEDHNSPLVIAKGLPPPPTPLTLPPLPPLTTSSHPSPPLPPASTPWPSLCSFSLITLTNSSLWITFSPVSHSVSSLLSVPTQSISLLSVVYMVVFVPFCFPAMVFCDTRGVKDSVLLAAILNSIGSLVRALSVRFESFGGVMAGQAVAAGAQCLVFAVPVALSERLFVGRYERERGLATGLAMAANYFGVGLGFALPALFVRDSVGEVFKERFVVVLFVQFGLSLVGLLAAFPCSFGGAHERPTPASPSAHHYVTFSRRGSAAEVSAPGAPVFSFYLHLKRLFTHSKFLLLLFAFSMVVGGSYAVSTVLLALFPGRSEMQIGWLGTGMMIVGAVVAPPLSSVVMNWRMLRGGSILITLVGVTFPLGLLALAVGLPSWPLGVAAMLMYGAGFNGLQPVLAERAAALLEDPVKKTPAAYSLAILFCGAQVAGIALTYAMTGVHGVRGVVLFSLIPAVLSTAALLRSDK